LSVTNSGAAKWTLHPKRFVDATANSTAFMDVLPNDTKTADFTRTVWPQNMQRALLGQITPDAMMQGFEKHFHG
jgi:multiple sugar transport system substrate-binding protein